MAAYASCIGQNRCDNTQQLCSSIYDHTMETYGRGDDSDDSLMSRCWFFLMTLSKLIEKHLITALLIYINAMRRISESRVL